MDRKLFMQRVNKLLAGEASNPLSWWYLSYADETGFKGAVVIQAHGPTEAVYLSRHRKLSPGGEVLILQIPDESVPPEECRNRLLAKEELVAIWDGEWATLEDLKKEGHKCQSIE
jgi:hypothetical protein